MLHQSPRGFLRISKGAVGGELHCDKLFVRDLISQPKQLEEAMKGIGVALALLFAAYLTDQYFANGKYTDAETAWSPK